MNINSYQWSPTLVAFSADPAMTTRSTSHHVWSLFSTNVFDQLLSTSSDSNFGPLYYSAGLVKSTGERIFKAAVYNTTTNLEVKVDFEGIKQGKQATVTILTAPDAFATNVHGGQNVVSTNITKIVADMDGSFNFDLPALSVAVLRTAREL
jgi:alpha-N-arabinofuranosidase